MASTVWGHDVKKCSQVSLCCCLHTGHSDVYEQGCSSALTRAGALAGVGLALDPEGNKRVLIQPSSFEKNTLNVTFLDFLTAEVQLIMIFRFSLGYVLFFGNRQISSLEKYINRS